MKLYYGSETLFIKPVYGAGKSNNDYGLGFYMTDSFEVAKLWATKSLNGGYVLSFDFDITNLNVLYLNSATEEEVLKWISILVNHRFDSQLKESLKDCIDWLDKKFHINIDAYDVIIGYRADDSYFNYSKEFVNDRLSFEVLTNAMKIGKLGLQYVAISQKAFEGLKFVKSQRFEHNNDYEIFQKRALEEYRSLKGTDSIDNTYIRDIMRKYGD